MDMGYASGSYLYPKWGANQNWGLLPNVLLWRYVILMCMPTSCNNCGKMGHKEKDFRSRNVASGTNDRSVVVCYECGERGHKSNACPKKADRQGGNVRGQRMLRSGDADVMTYHRVILLCGKKEVHVPYKNKTLVFKGDRGASRLKVISCIKARKYIKKGSQLFLAQVTEKEPSKKQLQDVCK
ncbi:putative reverse transcriptase domain-containing protein [Tanacetum coccineum]